MFNVEPTRILNDISSVSVVLAAADAGVKTKALRIAKCAKIEIETITKITKRAYVAPVKDTAVCTIPTANLTAGHYRINVDFKLSSDSQRSDLARFKVTKGKTVSIECTIASTGVVTPIVTAVTKFFKPYENKDVSLATSVATTNTLFTFTAGDEYIRFNSVTIEKFNPTSKEFEAFSTAVITRGTEGFGTPWQLIKNLRLPTEANLDLTALHQDERPNMAYQYTQYCIHYTVNRGKMGYQVAAGTAQSSGVLTLYVPTGNVAALETILTTDLGGTITTID